jgi:hypothetical protein
MIRDMIPAASIAGIAVVLSAAIFLSPAAATAAVTPQQKCEAGKNTVAGKYAACLHKAQQKFVNGGSVDILGRDTAAAACGTKSSDKWTSLEAKAGAGICPSEGDDTAVRDFMDACVEAVEDELAGGTLPLDVETCNADLATCDSDLATCEGDLATCETSIGVMRTGTTQCSDSSGVIIPCAGSGQDAAYMAGVPASYTDNGDGTVTDDVSGLMWEKLSDDASIHDKDTQYTWANAFSVKIAGLNGTNFAGHNDWRVPNIKELNSIINFGVTNPSTYPQLFNNCIPGCTVLTCACQQIASYWSSTSVNSGASAWVVFFAEGRTIFTLKTGNFAVRAVRGGL